MIRTITIDIINENALPLLHDLENLHLIRLRKDENNTKVIDWASKYKGAMTKQSIEDIDKQVNDMRSEWD